MKIKLTFKNFLEVYPNRKFKRREKIFKKLIISYYGENLILQERPTILGGTLFIALATVGFPFLVAWFGLKSVPELLSDLDSAFISFREDELHLGNPKTTELLLLSGYYFEDGELVKC